MEENSYISRDHIKVKNILAFEFAFIIIWLLYFLSSSLTSMTTKEIAIKLVQRMRSFDYENLYEDMFSADARNVEATEMYPGAPLVTVWTEALNIKGKWFAETFETISSEVTDPLINDNQFIIQMTHTVKNRHTDEVKTESEYILYTIENEKIVEERFFYM
jgi:hypothetical protein